MAMYYYELFELQKDMLRFKINVITRFGKMILAIKLMLGDKI